MATADDWLNQAQPADDWLQNAAPVAQAPDFSNVQGGAAPMAQFSAASPQITTPAANAPSFLDKVSARVDETLGNLKTGADAIISGEPYADPNDPRRVISPWEGIGRTAAEDLLDLPASIYGAMNPGVAVQDQLTGMPSATALYTQAVHQAVGVDENTMRFASPREEFLGTMGGHLLSGAVPLGGAHGVDMLSPEARAVMEGRFTAPEGVGAEAAPEASTALRLTHEETVPAESVPPATNALRTLVDDASGLSAGATDGAAQGAAIGAHIVDAELGNISKEVPSGTTPEVSEPAAVSDAAMAAPEAEPAPEAAAPVSPGGDLSIPETQAQAFTPTSGESPAGQAFTPAPTVDPAAITARFTAQLENYPQAVADYAANPHTEGGRILNTDTARELSPDYLADRTQSAAVHEPASAFIKQLYADKLSQPTPEGKASTVLFTAGGTGAGKSTGLKLLGDAANTPEIVYDTNMNKYASAKQKVEQALDAGRNVNILYTYREPVEALTGGALKRAMGQEKEFGSGRTVPVEEHLATHLGAQAVVNRLAEEYHNDPRVQITAIDNSRGLGNAAVVPLKELPQLNPKEDWHGRFSEALDQARQSGAISEAVYQGFKSPVARGGEPATGRAGGAELEPQRQGGSAHLVARAPSVSEEAPHAPDVRVHPGPARVGAAPEVPAGGEVRSRGDLQRPSEETGNALPQRLRGPGAQVGTHGPVPPRLGGGSGAGPPSGPPPARNPPPGPPHPGLPSNVAPNFQYIHDALGHLGEKAADRIVRDVGRRAMRSAWSEQARRSVAADNAVATAAAHFDRRPKAVRNDPRQALADVIAYQQGGLQAVKDPVAHAFIARMQTLLAEQVQAIRSIDPKFLTELRQNYVRQEWAEGSKPGAGMGRRPLGGNKSFTKERTFATIEEGLKAGYTPKWDNPVDYFLSRYASGEKLLASLRIRQDLAERGALRPAGADTRVPEGWTRMIEPAFAGHMIPEVIARDVTNYLSPGLNQYPGWRTFRAWQNRLISARLGVSLFHAGMTTLDTLYTHGALGLLRIGRGDVVGGFNELAHMLVSPIASPVMGRKLLKQFYGEAPITDANTLALLHTLVKGGMRGRMGDLNIHPEFNDDFKAALRAFRRHDWGKLGYHALPAAIEALARPMMQHLVPYQKMIARIGLLKFELDRVAGELGQKRGDYAGITAAAHPDFLAEIAKRVDDEVSNRLGQHTYDNYFWNRTARDILHASVTSVGWNKGWVNYLVGGALDTRRLAVPERLAIPLDKTGTKSATMARVTTRLAYLVTMTAVHFAIAAGIMWGLSGQRPETFKDLYYPRTGRKNRDGTDERLALPDFVKEEYALTHHPIETALHKLQPTWAMGNELLQNKDFYGTQIVDPDAGYPEQVADVLKYLAKGFEPYSVQGAVKARDAGASVGEEALSFVGAQPASGEISKTAFQSFVDEKYFDTLPRGARRQEDAEASKKLADARAAIQRGEEPDTSELTAKQRANLARYGAEPPWKYRLSKLGAVDLVRAFEKASPEEREEYHIADVAEEAIDKSDTLTPDKREELRARLNP